MKENNINKYEKGSVGLMNWQRKMDLIIMQIG